MSTTILVVDDEVFIVDLLATLLEDEGYTVLRAYDGEQGLAVAKQNHPQLIISDIMMPRKSGTELVSQLRAELNGAAAIPIILMSAVGAAVNVPYTIYLPKPFDIDQVLDLVKQLAPSV